MRVLLALALVACGGPRTEPAPHYDPAGTPEAATACPREAAAAKAAREVVLENESIEAGDAAARRVFELADCEQKAFDTVVLTSLEDLNALRETRARHDSIANLYAEVANYRIPRRSVGAWSRRGDLTAGYARKLRQLGEGAAEVDEVVALIDAEAAHAYRQALIAADAIGPRPDDAELRAWVAAACAGIGRHAAAGFSLCH